MASKTDPCRGPSIGEDASVAETTAPGKTPNATQRPNDRIRRNRHESGMANCHARTSPPPRPTQAVLVKIDSAHASRGASYARGPKLARRPRSLFSWGIKCKSAHIAPNLHSRRPAGFPAYLTLGASQYRRSFWAVGVGALTPRAVWSAVIGDPPISATRAYRAGSTAAKAAILISRPNVKVCRILGWHAAPPPTLRIRLIPLLASEMLSMAITDILLMGKVRRAQSETHRACSGVHFRVLAHN